MINMPSLDASCQVERLREIVSFDSGHAVQIMPMPSYLSALLSEENCSDNTSTDIILVYKAVTKTSTSSLPLDVRDESNLSVDSSIELGGDPLPAPFEDDDDFDVTISERKQHQWPKAELNHFPLRFRDALSILNKRKEFCGNDNHMLDVWCLVDGGISQMADKNSDNNGDVQNRSDISNSLSVSIGDLSKSCTDLKLGKKVRVLTGIHATEGWWTRSFVETQGVCSMASPEMDPHRMKNDHLSIANMPDFKMGVNVLCRYSISGQKIIHDPTLQISSCSTASAVTLELQWDKLSVTVPVQEASTKVLVQAAVGHPSSAASSLWKQLCVLHKLFDLLLSSLRDKVTPEALPHLDPLVDDSNENLEPLDSLESRLKTLILGGGQALQAQTANRRMSVAPSLLLGRQSMAAGFLGRMSIAPRAMKNGEDKDNNQIVSLTLPETVESAVVGTRDNADVTDQLWCLLAECKTYRELVQAWDLIFMELNESSSKPFIRQKNNSKAAKLIQGFLSGQVESSPDFLEGSLCPLELLIELGLEKLTCDYHYIFLDSQSVGRDELQAPSLVRFRLGVSKDRWLASCGQLLGWLAQVHTALEVLLPIQNSLPANSFSLMSSKALKYYQSEVSPVRSVAGLLSPGGFLQEFSFNVKTDAVRDFLTEKFDWWRMTLTSESETRKVKTVFLRSYLRPIFPPQLYDRSETLLPSEGIENVQYYCAEATTLSLKLFNVVNGHSLQS